MDNLQGQCTIEPLAPDDLLDALSSLKGNHADGVFVPAPGAGAEILMEWALNDIHSASSEPDPKSKARHYTNAVMNARRALSCMVDWYLRRDGFVFCKDAPSRADAKAAVLVRRRIVDELSVRVLSRAIDIRNQAEHQYSAVRPEQAEDVVELVRLTLQTMRARSEPARGPFLYGIILGGVAYSRGEYRGTFNGWDKPVAVLNTFANEPWIGVIIPSNRTNATVRRVRLQEVRTELLLDSFDLLERGFGEIGSWGDVAGCNARASAAGFA